MVLLNVCTVCNYPSFTHLSMVDPQLLHSLDAAQNKAMRLNFSCSMSTKIVLYMHLTALPSILEFTKGLGVTFSAKCFTNPTSVPNFTQPSTGYHWPQLPLWSNQPSPTRLLQVAQPWYSNNISTGSNTYRSYTCNHGTSYLSKLIMFTVVLAGCPHI